MAYVDGFVTPVQKNKLAACLRQARAMGRLMREHGALEYREAMADDVKWGKRTSFPRAVKLRPGETVFFSWVVFKSRKHRDAVNKRVMADKRMAPMMDPKNWAFDGKRLIYGGFKVMVDL